MSDGFTLSLDAAAVLRRFERLPKQVQEGAARGLERGLIVAESEFLRKTGVKLSGARSGLASRLTHKVKVGGFYMIDGVIGFRKTALFPYELAQEFGANAGKGAMAIPLSPEAKALSKRGVSARDFPRPLALVKSSKALLVESRKTRSVFHYVLVKSIRPRLRFRETMKNQAGQISRAIVEGSRETTGAGNG